MNGAISNSLITSSLNKTGPQFSTTSPLCGCASSVGPHFPGDIVIIYHDAEKMKSLFLHAARLFTVRGQSTCTRLRSYRHIVVF